jgi:hypothetical protein
VREGLEILRIDRGYFVTLIEARDCIPRLWFLFLPCWKRAVDESQGGDGRRAGGGNGDELLLREGLKVLRKEGSFRERALGPVEERVCEFEGKGFADFEGE